MADSKISALTALTAYDGAELLPIVDDPGGTPATKKASLDNLLDGFLSFADGTMLNGKIVVTISSNDLVVTLKTRAGNTPSATDAVWIKINGTWRKCTAATSVTKADGTNWANLGSAELGTLEQDLFIYAVWNTGPATDIVDVAWSRIPWGSVYSDFSGTTTNEKYLAYGNASAPASTDDCVVIGRIAATLSLSGTGYLWTSTSQSAPTSVNTIQRPVYETRWLTWTPAWSASGSLTYTSVSTVHAHYRLSVHKVDVKVRASGTLGGTASNVIFCTSPFAATLVADTPAIGSGFTAGVYGGMYITAATGLYSFIKYDNSNYATSGSNIVNMIGAYEI